MAASTTGRDAKMYTDPVTVSFPVEESTTLYNKCAVAVNAAGYAVNVTDSAAVKFVGVSESDVDNSAGADGAENVVVRRKGVFAFVSANLAITDQDCDLYWSDNQTVSKTPSNLYAGKLYRYTSATEALVDIEPAINRKVNRFVLSAFAEAGAASGIVVIDGYEHPCAFKVVSGFAKCQTAPGGSYVTTIAITDGTTPKTVTITGTATTGENKTINTAYAANADIDITVTDSDDSAATEDIQIFFVCEEL